MSSRYLIVTDRQTDGRTDESNLIYRALRLHRAVKSVNSKVASCEMGKRCKTNAV